MERAAKVARFGESWTPRLTEEASHAIAPHDQHGYNHEHNTAPDDNPLISDEDQTFYAPQHTSFSTDLDILSYGLDSLGSHLEFCNHASLGNGLFGSKPKPSSRGRKRNHQEFVHGQDGVANKGPIIRGQFPNQFSRDHCPPPAEEDLDTENPYASDSGSCSHPHALVRCGGARGHEGPIVVDGFIKTSIRIHGYSNQKRGYADRLPLLSLPTSELERQDDGARESDTMGSVPNSGPTEIIHHPPPRFGDVRIDGKFEEHDRYLFQFFTKAVCNGRTVVANDNAYLTQITPMADKCPAVKHAMLSVSLSYILDYTARGDWIHLATYHYQQAVCHLSQEVKNAKDCSPDKADSLVASLILLGHTEIVVWDRDQGNMRPRNNEPPKWYRGAKLAERCLAQSNPATRCQSRDNAQTTRVRSQLGIRVCLDSVLSDCVHPLDPNTEVDHYNWLIQGTERERRRIDGFAGLSHDLMHYFAKITHLASMRVRCPASGPVQLPVARKIKDKLNNFRQWSDLSEGYQTSQELLDSCELDENGKVATNVKVTELIGESYVAAAQIYLQCRVFRRRRDHQIVKELLDRLILTIKYQPISGPLFTAQTPLFAVFIGGLVAYEQDDRRAISAWFDPICEGPRGNVPPAYEALKYAWRWQDDYERRRGKVAQRAQDDGPGEGSDGEEVWENTDPWWEKLVRAMTSKCGRINLC